MTSDCRTTERSRLSDIQIIRSSGLLDPLVFSPFGSAGNEPTLPPEAAYLGNKDNWRLLASALFDGASYLSKYRSIAQSDFSPLLHYIRHGFHEGRAPAAHIDLDYVFIQAHPEIQHEDEDAFRRAKLSYLASFEGLR